MVAANCPVFYFHHDERYRPTTDVLFLSSSTEYNICKHTKRLARYCLGLPVLNFVGHQLLNARLKLGRKAIAGLRR